MATEWKMQENQVGERKQSGVRNVDLATLWGIHGDDLLGYPWMWSSGDTVWRCELENDQQINESSNQDDNYRLHLLSQVTLCLSASAS